MDIKEKIAGIPNSSGVYLFRDKQGNVIYIGKAASLKKRLFSYFNKQYTSAKQDVMLSKAQDIDYILTDTEPEALILESFLIKEGRPKYNVSLKDDKNYPLVKITDSEDFPRLVIARRKLKDGSIYFGPYTNAKLLRQALNVLRRIFPYRTCRHLLKKPCLDYDLKICPAPCSGRITKKEYRGNITHLCLFLSGQNERLLKEMSGQMAVYARQHNFEKAKELRDKISALSNMSMHNVPSVIGGASIASYEIESEALKNILRLRNRPQRIEAFDISSISGENVVGSMVSFLNGGPDKNNYRRFRIKGEGFDDYSAIREVIRRRYQRIISEHILPPDLIIIDGGKGQLSSAGVELRALKLKIPIISIAKKEEEIFRPEQDRPLELNQDSPALNLIRRIRNEAHRFALAYHRILRKKKTFNFPLSKKGPGLSL